MERSGTRRKVRDLGGRKTLNEPLHISKREQPGETLHPLIQMGKRSALRGFSQTIELGKIARVFLVEKARKQCLLVFREPQKHHLKNSAVDHLTDTPAQDINRAVAR